MTKIGDAYRWFHGRIAERPTNFSWVIEGKLAGCGLPFTEDEFEWLVERGIRSIVTVREVPLPSDWFSGSDVSYKHVKVEDFGAPTIEELDASVAYIEEQIAAGRPVMVHCAAGKGRTGTVLAAYLVKNENLTAQQAIEKLRRIRPGSVQSVVQETAVSMYEKFLKSKEKSEGQDSP
ncbi:MAG TPA: dual specificity protein phosphatase 23 [Nitrososphaera sp.]|nr:dual specificity protein phosphatase 23 [Nitrososphaera sp.]